MTTYSIGQTPEPIGAVGPTPIVTDAAEDNTVPSPSPWTPAQTLKGGTVPPSDGRMNGDEGVGL
ncbi:hypothetical protein FE257_003526 [Aspergillus nanangensis]|uniref:Uncharacterized protein n=1 Tax=Aspergillus nanangensis TaxID=2582783 RepID=A0AAD4CBE2_ASPNN|nr:hypothetical protein FE257_003526 [Aspergillus nanangensis]